MPREYLHETLKAQPNIATEATAKKTAFAGVPQRRAIGSTAKATRATTKGKLYRPCHIIPAVRKTAY